nr:PKD domain-containing protein [Bacteroidota bacterium]
MPVAEGILIGDNYSNDHPFYGVIDDLRIYDRTLSESEIQELFNEGGWDPLQQGLVAHYPFNGNANDESGHGYHLTENGAVLTEDRFGIPNSAYYFDGNNSDLIDNVNYPGFELKESISFAAWINPDNVTPSIKMGIAGKGNSTHRNYDLFITPESKIHFYVEDLDTTVVESNTVLQTGEWYFVVGVYEINQKLKIYVDGLLDSELATFGIPASSASEFAIGCQGRNKCTNYSQAFEGIIDDVRLYDKALSDSEIYDLYIEGGLDITADFDASYTEGGSPLLVKYTDLSSGNPTTWQWDFDSDGEIDSFEQNPEHIYDVPGFYTVSLTVTNGANTDTEIKDGFIMVDDTWHCGYPILDTRNNQQYNTVQIGERCWMSENLNIGTMINGTEDMQDNDLIEKYCYEDNEANCDIYGGLYQWDELMQYTNVEGAQGICPDGWHVPTHEEWCTLENEVDAGSIPCNINNLWVGTDAGGNLKESGASHWQLPNIGATNSSGFTALPAGTREHIGDSMAWKNLTTNCYWWSSSENANGINAIRHRLSYNHSQVLRTVDHENFGFSVRCIKNIYPPVVDLGDDITTCEGETVTLNAGNPDCSYLWSTSETTQTIEVISSGNYSVVVTNEDGSDSDDVDVLFILMPNANAGDNATICKDESFTLAGSAQNYDGISWSSLGDG